MVFARYSAPILARDNGRTKDSLCYIDRAMEAARYAGLLPDASAGQCIPHGP